MIQKNPYFKNVPSKNTSSTRTKMDKAQEREREIKRNENIPSRNTCTRINLG